MLVVLTERLEVRPLVEADRTRFVELFTDAEFMVISGVLTRREADGHFDHLLALNCGLTIAKQPIVVRASGEIVGYAGVDWFEYDGQRQLEFGYRLVPAARGLGYATEASRALLASAAEQSDRAIFAIIDPTNDASRNTARKLGFELVERTVIDGEPRDLFEWCRTPAAYSSPDGG